MNKAKADEGEASRRTAAAYYESSHMFLPRACFPRKGISCE